MASTSPYSGCERHHAERLSVCSGLTLAKNPTLVEADFTRIKSEYYPALREGGSSLIIVNNIFTAAGVMARCQDDPDILCIEDGLQEWIAGKNGHNHKSTIKAAKYLKTLTFRKEGGGCNACYS